jgi:hypothetical protein
VAPCQFGVKSGRPELLPAWRLRVYPVSIDSDPAETGTFSLQWFRTDSDTPRDMTE